jgi:hypothetical protein
MAHPIFALFIVAYSGKLWWDRPYGSKRNCRRHSWRLRK